MLVKIGFLLDKTGQGGEKLGSRGEVEVHGLPTDSRPATDLAQSHGVVPTFDQFTCGGEQASSRVRLFA